MRNAALYRKNKFDLYAQNLRHWFEKSNQELRIIHASGEVTSFCEAAIFCPLCMRVFTERSLRDDAENRLTIEHVPPESVGGKPKVLICKKCNSNTGIEIDHHIQRQMNLEPVLKGLPGSLVEARLRVNDGRIPFKFSFKLDDDGAFVLTTQYDKNTRSQLKSTMSGIVQNWDKTILNINIRGGNPRREKLAMLKAAYLEMFALFGHSFILQNENAERIRHQIMHPEQELLPHSSILAHSFDDSQVGVHIIYEPINYVCFLVVIKLEVAENNYTKHVGVILPGPGPDGWTNYTNFGNTEPVPFRYHTYSNFDSIRNKNATFAYQEIWAHTKSRRM